MSSSTDTIVQYSRSLVSALITIPGKRRCGLIMTLSGTITDFDEAGLFGLILADEGFFFPFNLRETPPALRGTFAVGTRVNFVTRAAGATMRATDLVPIEATESVRVTGLSGSAEGR